MDTPKPHRVLLADDHQIVRDGLRLLLETLPEPWLIVGEADDGHAAVRLAAEHQPDVVIMDIGMPDLNGIEATARIQTASPNSRVLALSMRTDRRSVVEMFRAGARAYLLKTSAFRELRRALEAVLGGRTYVSSEIASILVDVAVGRTDMEPSPAWDSLTGREREVLQLIAEGFSTKDIASKLFVSVKTIETHRKQVMDKLGIHSVAGLTRYAIQQGIVTIDGPQGR